MTTRTHRIKCGNCKLWHGDVYTVRACYTGYDDENDLAEMRAEAEAEARYERWLEDGGPHAEIIAWENQEDLRREQHSMPDTCGTYDRCHEQRLRDAAAAPTHNAAIRAMHRAYND